MRNNIANGDDAWHWADAVITAFMEAHPLLWRAFVAEQGLERAALNDPKFGRSDMTLRNDNYDFRKTATFPVDFEGNSMLTNLLKFYPDLMKNKRRWRAFLRRYPVFSITEQL